MHLTCYRQIAVVPETSPSWCAGTTVSPWPASRTRERLTGKYQKSAFCLMQRLMHTPMPHQQFGLNLPSSSGLPGTVARLALKASSSGTAATKAQNGQEQGQLQPVQHIGQVETQ
jgi:hypothetical protein